MPFIPLKKVEEQDLKTRVIANSATVAVGDALIVDSTNKNAVIGAANTTGIIVGVCVSLKQLNGNSILEKNSITVGASNETTTQYAAVFVPAYIPIEYTATLSAAAGTTTGSDKMGQFNLSASVSGTLDETSVGVFSTQKQFFSYGVSTYSTTEVAGKFSTSKVL